MRGCFNLTGGGVSTGMPRFDYTGECDLVAEDKVDGVQNWLCTFKTGGKLTPKRNMAVQVCIVGGGGSGGGGNGSGGGAGVQPQAMIFSCNASAMRNILPTLCALRRLSSTSVTSHPGMHCDCTFTENLFTHKTFFIFANSSICAIL